MNRFSWKKALLFVGRCLTNKYLWVLALFVVLMFEDEHHNIPQHVRYRREVRRLRQEIRYYKQRIAEDDKRQEQLRSDKDSIEKFARERYHLKAPGEDVFVVIE